MAFVLVSGALHKTPEQKTSKSGKPFTVATLKARDGDGFAFWRLTAFSDAAQAELMRLSEGDALAAQGALQVSIWVPEGGEARVNLAMVAECVLALRLPKKSKPVEAAASPKPKGSSLERAIGDGFDVFGDCVGF